MNKRLLFTLLPLAVLVLGYILMQTFSGMREETVRRPPARVAKSVAATVVTMEPTPTVIEALGRLASSQPVQLSSEVAGTLQRGDVPFQPGQRFRRGQVLLRIDDRQLLYNLNSMKSDFLNALATVLPELKVEFPEAYTQWQEYFDRCSFDGRLVPLPEAQERKIKLLLTRFNVYKLYFAVKNLEVVLEKHTITAPFSGSVVSTAQREGSSARVGGVLGEIISLENLELQAPVPASDIQWIDRSKPVRLTADGLDGSWTGTVTRIGSAIDQRTHTIPVYIGVRGDVASLFEGLYIRAEIPGQSLPSATAVPRRALYEERYVYVVEDGRLQRRDVTISRKNPQNVIVSEGLRSGDTLVTELLQGVSHGMPAVARLADGRGERE